MKQNFFHPVSWFNRYIIIVLHFSVLDPIKSSYKDVRTSLTKAIEQSSKHENKDKWHQLKVRKLALLATFRLDRQFHTYISLELNLTLTMAFKAFSFILWCQ